ncbi:hypothetical protein R69658_07914 [Paraburkholderia aspalathi]|uniref:Uncharacterized protein n=1 Tax=Paraburkholderia aspalathi TaxID=1324617 RepID=A0ABM8T850_9BURK|nr:hypothetical protein [Paraburkholderia aspalathi]MBK3824165.1 hypothetical protein [Paraburkholderia aspalathi]MBK3836007.1 hypothetical protein [Paraburkholderia aspalathi]MBK3865777.1 hypothetical protein [Paraburkholderia aspalathi]CAE6866909.1 hypothetical protein R69658_07914 [Paraburkholderia aspalathi]
MAIIRDEKGNIYNIPDSELQKYLVPIAPAQKGDQPDSLCLDPKVDVPLGPHDGWNYVKNAVRPLGTKKATVRSSKTVATAKPAAKKAKSKKAK